MNDRIMVADIKLGIFGNNQPSKYINTDLKVMIDLQII